MPYTVLKPEDISNRLSEHGDPVDSKWKLTQVTVTKRKRSEGADVIEVREP